MLLGTASGSPVGGEGVTALEVRPLPLPLRAHTGRSYCDECLGLRLPLLPVDSRKSAHGDLEVQPGRRERGEGGGSS